MSIIILIAASLISYLQAWSYTKTNDVSQYRLLLLLIIVLVSVIYFYLDVKNKKRQLFLYEKVSWGVLFLLVLVTSFDAQKFYLLIPFVLGFIFATTPIKKLIGQMIVIYSVFFCITFATSLITGRAAQGLWGFYHPNIASGYLVGIQILLLLYSVYEPPKKTYLILPMLFIPVLNFLTVSSAGIIVSVLLSLLFFSRRRIHVYKHTNLILFLSLLPCALNYIIILIYKMNLGGVGKFLDTALSSRPYIWTKTTETYTFSLFPTKDKILFFDDSGTGYTMPIDSVYVQIPLACGLLFSFIFLFLFLRFSLIGRKINLKHGEIKLNTLLLCHLLMLLYGIIESHAIEYQVNPLIIIMIICVYRKYSLKEKDFLW
ncbi:hypothetical protein [Bifidobacterium subtile]|uniref:hypothetical protein n=1 Tax=Bifidobacterium subtile TaxID=77635 RepID=UPI002F361294